VVHDTDILREIGSCTIIKQHKDQFRIVILCIGLLYATGAHERSISIHTDYI
jgi:hypothetical protein